MATNWMQQTYNTNPINITWADFASGITAATTKNLVAVVKDSTGNVISTAPAYPSGSRADTGYNSNHRLNWPEHPDQRCSPPFYLADRLAYFSEHAKNNL